MFDPDFALHSNLEQIEVIKGMKTGQENQPFICYLTPSAYLITSLNCVCTS